MCGIAGLWDTAAASSADELRRLTLAMSDSLVHRGPDDGGLWVDEAAGIGLGQRRLSIVDLSPAGHQPMISACGRYVIVYNGEVYSHEEMRPELTARGIKVVADIPTEPGQVDYSAVVVNAAKAGADALFSYKNEEESARFLREARKQGLNKPLLGETTLLGQKVIELAGDAANGVKGHVGLTVDAPLPAIQEFGRKYEAKFGSKPDHNGVKGYIAPYMIKAAAEKAGKLDAKAIAAALHGMTITPDKVPGILIEATWDDTGEIDRISFLGEVKDGKQVITEILPKLKK